MKLGNSERQSQRQRRMSGRHRVNKKKRSECDLWQAHEAITVASLSTAHKVVLCRGRERNQQQPSQRGSETNDEDETTQRNRPKIGSAGVRDEQRRRHKTTDPRSGKRQHCKTTRSAGVRDEQRLNTTDPQSG